MKKTILGAVAAILCSAAAFAEMDFAGGTLEFVNKLDSTPLEYTKNPPLRSDLDGIRFKGIYNTTEITFKTDFLDLYIEPYLQLYNSFDFNNKGKKYNHGDFSCRLNEYDITIKPFEKVWFGIFDEMYTKGSYCPVSDGNVLFGALGTNFTVLYMPVEGLKITAGLPVGGEYHPNIIYNSGYEDSYTNDKDGNSSTKTRPIVNTGIEYTYDESLCLAFIVRDLFFNKSHYNSGDYINPDYNNPYYCTSLGFYASFDTNKWLGQNLTVNAGYTFMADRKYNLLIYKNSWNSNYADLLSASVEWKNEKFDFAAQGQLYLTKSQYAKDTNSSAVNPYQRFGFKAGYTVNEKWLAECYVYIDKYEEYTSYGTTYGEMYYYTISPYATYTYNEHNKFRAGLNYNFYTDRWNSTTNKYEERTKTFSVNFRWTYTL